MGVITKIKSTKTFKGGIIMNRIAIITVTLLGLSLSGCKTQQKTAGVNYDDAYVKTSVTQDYSRPATTTPQNVVTVNDSTAAVKSATVGEDYSDYSYSSRVKRFHNAEKEADYFDPVYTDTENYDTTATNESVAGSSSSPDVNIYLGTGWGGYSPYTTLGFSYGWGYDPWNYGFYGYPYSYWYPSYYSYWDPFFFGHHYYPYYYPYNYYGYWNGYWNGYWDGYYGYGDPYGWDGHHGHGFPGEGGYYGHRTFVGNGSSGHYRPDVSARLKRAAITGTPEGNDGTKTRVLPTGTGTGNNQRVDPTNVTTPRAVTEARSTTVERSTGTTTPAQRSNTAVRTNTNNQQQYKYTRPSSERQAPAQRQNTGYQRQNTQPNPKYARPGSGQQATRTTTENYSSPLYRQPKSSQEYLSPRSQSTTTRQTSTQGVRTNSQQRQSTPTQGTQRTYTTPQRQNVNPGNTPSRSNTPGYSTPQRQNNSGSSRGSYTPSSRSGQSYSTPSRSGSSRSSYSAPSRSGGSSSSAPSRSGGSSSSRSSGSGSSNGHRK